VGFSHSERNFSAAAGPKLFFEVNGPHNFRDVADTSRHVEALEKFLRLIEQRDMPIGRE
jgi:hypothetical protein